ncbi:hypothetical protein G6F32_016120 [Rhizopus arrhizus]|nr:hypothetical protein G6F32_016120 [Rhizopus arrhizus]
MATYTGGSGRLPILPSAVMRKVLRARTTWSIQTFNDDGTVKLCIGVAMTICVAACRAWINRVDCRSAPRPSTSSAGSAGALSPAG